MQPSNETIGQWKQLVRDIAYELHAQNSEQIESAEVGRAVIFRQIKWNREDTNERIAKAKQATHNS